jgi:group I intron endonuclease
MNRDYQKGKIYKITNDYNNDVYVGSTCDTLVKRFSHHKNSIYITAKNNRPLYKLMKEIGRKRFVIYLIEDFPCNNKYELERREGYWQKELNSVLNFEIAGRTKQEYREENKEKYEEYYKIYRSTNNDKIKEYKKEYYVNNKEEVIEKRKEEITCECGSTFRKCDISRHNKTKKHQDFIANIEVST